MAFQSDTEKNVSHLESPRGIIGATKLNAISEKVAREREKSYKNQFYSESIFYYIQRQLYPDLLCEENIVFHFSGFQKGSQRKAFEFLGRYIGATFYVSVETLLVFLAIQTCCSHYCKRCYARAQVLYDSTIMS